MNALWSKTELEELTALAAELTRLKDELVRDRKFLSEEADRWGRNITPRLIAQADVDSVEGCVRSRLERFEELQRQSGRLRLEELPTLSRLWKDCEGLVKQIRNCELVRLPSNAVLAKDPSAA